jgi:hypothetical protein
MTLILIGFNDSFVGSVACFYLTGECTLKNHLNSMPVLSWSNCWTEFFYSPEFPLFVHLPFALCALAPSEVKSNPCHRK